MKKLPRVFPRQPSAGELSPPRATAEFAAENPAQFDNRSVTNFAYAMRVKLAVKRLAGRGGWQDKKQCSGEYLSKLLREHVEKGDPVDVANFCMMLHQRGELIASPAASKPLAWYWEDKSGCFHMVMDRADVQEMAAEFFCDPQPLYPEAPSPAASLWQTMDTAPRNGTVIQAWHTVHKCPISILWNEKGHDFNGETLHWFERSYSTVWPEGVFSHWMPLPSQPVTEGGAA